MRRFDHVVVGGGAAGAVLARRLADAGRHVGLVEGGPSDAGRLDVAALDRYREVLRGPLARRLPIAGRPGVNLRVTYPVADVLGGGTSLNTCVWFRPPPADFRDWEAAGAAGWGPAAATPAFAALEQRIGIETVAADADPHQALLRAAADMGYREIDFGRPHGDGIGRYRLSKRGGSRRSTSAVFLHEAPRPPPSLRLFTGTRAIRLVFDADRKVAGVETTAGTFLADRDVVVSAGAFGTPKLLMLSGIGPAEELRAQGIAVRHDLPGVGRHLIDHPACALNLRAARPLARLPTWNYAGVLFAHVHEPHDRWADIEVQLGPETFEQQTAPAGYPGAEHGFCAYLTANRARSEGQVRLASPSPDQDPVIAPNFFSDPDGYDIAVMTGGLRLARGLFAAPALAGWTAEELAPGAAVVDDPDLAAYARATVTTGYHPAGTCRMGAAGAPGTVVGPDLRVSGIGGLRIADASVFPTMVSVNIASTCMMVGWRCADILTGEGARPPMTATT